MEEAQDQEDRAGEVIESLGISEKDVPHESEEVSESGTDKPSNASLSVQKRLKAQRRAHERELRELNAQHEARYAELESRMTQPQSSQNQNLYNGNPNIDEHIHKAVSIALQHKENEERKAHEAQNAQHVIRKYQDFQRHLDNMSDKYEDFHDVVMASDAPYTSAMRDYAARTMSKHGPGSAGEVLYKLGKNPEELKRIASLHPDDQAEELHKLSLALSNGGEKYSASSKSPLGNIKSNPVVNSAAVTDKTPIKSIRERMKSGTWK